MPQAPLSRDTHAKILKCFKDFPGMGVCAVAAKLGVSQGAVSKYRHIPLADEAPAVEVVESELGQLIKKTLKRGPCSDVDLANVAECSPAKIQKVIAEMKSRGAMIIQTVDGKFDLASSILIEPGKHEVVGTNDEWTHHFGVTTDNHLCNKHSRLDVLKEAYQYFAQQGITTVYNCGNWIDGEARFNKTELLTAPGMDHQLDYLIDNWPVHDGITTHYVAGDDHEGWYQQREGVEIGKYLQLRAENQGRHDLKYLGYAECDVALKHGDGEAVMRVLHPGGGSAYAISYTDQKRTESYQGGEKPQVELVGHYHKWNHGFPREVHTIQCGTTCDQSLFMRKKRLQAHVGFVEVKIKQDESGVITRVAAEWFPYFNRSYYEHRF